jgi:hypothetical protein
MGIWENSRCRSYVKGKNEIDLFGEHELNEGYCKTIHPGAIGRDFVVLDIK